MFSGTEIVDLLVELGVTHVVMLPDSTLGLWESALQECNAMELVRVCREGEAWAVAGGLYLGGACPIVMIQCTGMFESGDALRNIIHDYRLPIFAVIGFRSYLNQDTIPGDTCLTFTEPVLQSWRIDYRLIERPDQFPDIAEHFHNCQQKQIAGAVLLAEGKA